MPNTPPIPPTQCPPPANAVSRLMEHLASLRDPRQLAKVIYPLPEILLLGLAATLAGADDGVEMVRWGRLHLD
uniref:transposase family protein n=2 Tax=Thiofilum flexile TaxID=125627 RepID=UPI00035D01D4